MTLLKATILLLFSAIVFIGCSKENAEEPFVTGSLKIISLTTASDTLMAWDTTTIKVITNLPATLIKWEADHGTIMGSGSAISYYAGMCCMGTNRILCRAESENGTDTASIRIHITPWIP